MIRIIDWVADLTYPSAHSRTHFSPGTLMNRLITRITVLSLSLLLSLPALADLLNPNTATEAELAAVEGLDAKTVMTIVSSRPFKTSGDLDKALAFTLDDAAREALYATLFVPINLNSASRADILLIPGVGGKMAHEFEEYRPYSSMEQFRREIGKYVDQDEVARLEMYVTLED